MVSKFVRDMTVAESAIMEAAAPRETVYSGQAHRVAAETAADMSAAEAAADMTSAEAAADMTAAEAAADTTAAEAAADMTAAKAAAAMTAASTAATRKGGAAHRRNTEHHGCGDGKNLSVHRCYS
jgi:hypothetical protein